MVFDKNNWTIRGFISSFFPFQLILGQLKYNLISLFYWTLLFLIVSDSFGSAFGVPFLFFSPEYHGEVNEWAFLFVGFSFGGFTMAFNTYSYIKLGPRYPFLAAVSRPFLKFCINNSFIPLFFIIYYLSQMISFQRADELASATNVFLYSISFLAGFIAFITLSIFYFFPTTKDTEVTVNQEQSSNPIASVVSQKIEWYNYFRSETKRTYLYFGKGLKIYQSRSVSHLEQELIERIFAKNRINATIFEILTITAFFIFSMFRDSQWMEFPAAMSIVLLFTIIHMLFSAMMSWFHRWTYPIIFFIVIGMNFLSTRTHFFKYINYAYGLDYSENKLQDFSMENIRSKAENYNSIENSRTNYTSILQNWHTQTNKEKPKLIIVNTSGGGSRSALWTFSVLQNCDKETKGELTKHLQMISGASGGMVGAAYFRELLLRSRTGKLLNLYNPEYKNNLSKDLLNKLAFSASTNDLFVRFQSMTHNGFSYTKDRGYAFEEHLHENTNQYMRHDLGYYEQPEKNATIPVMIFSPTIVNDGRRLFISSQSLSFMTEPGDDLNQIANSHENIDYQTFFKDNSPQNMRFSSALRASASFPFIMPMITMPTKPEMQLMDAGIRDNYGFRTAADFLYNLRDWIEENTSGVIIIEIRDTKKILNNENYMPVSFMDKITLPFGNMYNNFPRTQDFDQEQLMKIGLKSFPFKVDIVTFNLREKKDDRISLSWHLTKQEKVKIEQAFLSMSNQFALKRVKELLKDK
jgi:hypothetical protein